MNSKSLLSGLAIAVGLALPGHASAGAREDAGAAPNAPGAERTARTTSQDRGTVQLSVALMGSFVTLSGDESEAPDGTGQGLSLTAAFFPLQRLGVIAEVWRQWAEFPMCHADAACYTDRAEEQTMLTAGVRFPIDTSRRSTLTLDVAAGAAASETRYTGRLWSPVFAGTLSWRMRLGPVEAGLMARASTLNQSESDLQVTTLGFGLLAGKSW